MTEAEKLLIKEALDLANKALTQLEGVQNTKVRGVAHGLSAAVMFAEMLLG